MTFADIFALIKKMNLRNIWIEDRYGKYTKFDGSLNFGECEGIVYIPFQQHNGFICHEACLDILDELIEERADMATYDPDAYNVYKTSIFST